MKKITERIKNAFDNGQSLKVNNTTTDGTSVWLWGNEIIRRDQSGAILFTFAGWGSVTTRERLKGIIGVDVYQKNKEQYYNGQKVFDLHSWFVKHDHLAPSPASAGINI